MNKYNFSKSVRFLKYGRKCTPNYIEININIEIGIKSPMITKLCMPDYNVYTEKKNKKPNAKNQNLRSAGFHIHVGYDHPTVPESLRMVKLLDIFLGIPSVIIDPDKKRRELYGRAGAFRLTKYGFEYRTLSSYMMSKDSILNLIWDLLTLALNFGGLPNAFDKNQIQYIINESDVEEAKKFLNNFEYIKESYLERVQNFLKTFEV